MVDYSFKSPDASDSQKIYFVDNLRAIAILLVILHHVGEASSHQNSIYLFSQFGSFGVQLFFVMSAFTMCYTSAKLTIKPSSVFSFYIKRFFRIAPLYYIAIGCYFVLAYSSLTIGSSFTITDIKNYTLLNVLSNFFFLHGLYFPGNNNIVPGGWSIGYEILFYIIFPFLLFLYKKSKFYLIPVQLFSWLILAIFLFVARMNGHHGIGGGSSFAYYFIANQIPTFLLGMLLFFYWENNKFRMYIALLSLPSLLILGFSNISHWTWLLFPMCAGILSCLLAIFVSKITLPSIFIKFGKVSYSMYISHFFFVWVSVEIFDKKNNIFIGDITPWLVFVFVSFASYTFSKITYKFIEIPFINLGKNIASKFKNYKLGFVF